MKLILGLFVTYKVVLADLTADFTEVGIIPDMLDEAPNLQLLSMSYHGREVKLGEEWTPTQCKGDPPDVQWNFDPSSYYTLIMSDPDAPSRERPKLRECLYWLVKNIPGDDFEKGENLCEYSGVGPPEDGGIHRVVALVYKQPGILSFNETYTGSRKFGFRMKFSQKKFSQKYNLGTPVSGIYFLSRFDDYVPILYKEFMSGR